MLKLAGALMIIVSAGGIGISCSVDVKRYCMELRLLKQMLYMLRGEIKYTKTPLEEAFLAISVRMPEPFSLFLKRTAEEMENADLLRGLVAQGHAVALRLTGQTEEEAAGELERARELLWQAACSWLELVWYEGGADLGALLEAEGCARVSGTLDQRSRGLTGSGQAGTLLRTIGRYREDVSVYLGGGRLGGLTPLLEGLEEGGYRVCAWRLTASQHLFST